MPSCSKSVHSYAEGGGGRSGGDGGAMRSDFVATVVSWSRVRGCLRGRIQCDLGRVRESGHRSACRRMYLAVFVGG